MNFYEKYTALCVKKGKSPTACGIEMGFSKGTVSVWRKGGNPNITTLYKVADFFGVSVEYFTDNSPVESENADMFRFPVVGSIKAGYNGMMNFNETDDYVYFTKNVCRNKPSNYFCLKVKGLSMYPQFLEGDVVLCRRCETVESGRVAVILYNDDEATVKKVEYVYGQDWLRLVPANPNYPPIQIEKEQLEHCKVIGEVVALQRSVI